MNNFKIAAAVALALGGTAASQTTFAQAASPAQCAAATATLYVAGSSAAQSAVQAALRNDLFDANGITTFQAPAVSGSANGNFRAYCGFARAGNGAGITAGATTLVHYRGEGGSVLGVLPVVSGRPVKFLNLTLPGCAVTNPSVVGLSANVGPTDGWTGCVTTHAVEMGISDLEPTVFVAPNYPSLYSTGVFGSASPAQLGLLASTPLFQQVFGIFVNTTGLTTPVNLSRQTVANILDGSYTDWSAVPNASGGAMSSVSLPINIVNREAGSGTRTGTSIFFLGTNCTNPAFQLSLSDPTPATDGYATGDVLGTANSNPGSITYASIDNVSTSRPNLALASIDGTVPSNLAAASGTYGWWFEATAQRGNITSPGGTGLFNFLTGGELQNLATAPHAVDVLAIPNAGSSNPPNPATVPLTSNGSPVIYINPFTRSGNSCNTPAATNF
jgi:ABC-type phosphate transport system substrate-binding protein